MSEKFHSWLNTSRGRASVPSAMKCKATENSHDFIYFFIFDFYQSSIKSVFKMTSKITTFRRMALPSLSDIDGESNPLHPADRAIPDLWNLNRQRINLK